MKIATSAMAWATHATHMLRYVMYNQEKIAPPIKTPSDAIKLPNGSIKNANAIV